MNIHKVLYMYMYVTSVNSEKIHCTSDAPATLWSVKMATQVGTIPTVLVNVVVNYSKMMA